jgi:hypothetical protein
VADGKDEEAVATEADSTMCHCSSNGSINSALRHRCQAVRGSLCWHAPIKA